MLSSPPLARMVTLALLALASGADAQALTYADLIGWWRSDLEHNGQRAEIYLRFTEDGGKPAVRVTLPPIQGWDFPFGSATVAENSVQLNAVPLTLVFDPAAQTLSAELPPELAPAAKIAVVFRKATEPQKPATDEWPAMQPKVAWSSATDGPVWAGLANDAASHRLFVASDAGSVVALDARSGAHLWSVATGDKVRAQPVVDGEFVYVGSADGNLYALDAGSGREVWRAASKGKVYASPIRHGDAVIFGSFDGLLYSVAAADGKPRWQIDTRGAISTAPAIAGKREWQRALGGWCWPEVAVTRDRVYAGVSAASGASNVSRGALVALDRKSGKVQWAHVVPATRESWGFVASPAVADGRVFAADLDGRVYAFKAE